jgi:hypothetical protein
MIEKNILVWIKKRKKIYLFTEYSSFSQKITHMKDKNTLRVFIYIK